MPNHPIQQDLFPIEITLPALWYRKNLPKLGTIICRIIDSKTYLFSTIKTLPKRRSNSAIEYKLSNSTQFLITSTTNDRKLRGYEGILLSKDNEERWLYHDNFKKFDNELFGDDVSYVRNEIRNSWGNQFTFKAAVSDQEQKGLRSPQLGALHSVLAHWSLNNEPVTIVMPTGTGKTETMLSLMVVDQPTCLLVIVPSQALRTQISNKFAILGILKQYGIVSKHVRTPIVGIIKHEISSIKDLEIFDQCNVIVSVVNSVASGSSVSFLKEMANRCSHLIFDEAHHVPAVSWSRLKSAFKNKKILQFTATPFREDRSSIGGKIIYNYPLSSAQKDGYFKPIKFKGIFEIDQEQADLRISEEAITQLRDDLHNGYNHRLLARCKTIKRAKKVLNIYQAKASDLNPTIVYSNATDPITRIENLRNGNHKIVVTVDMLKEGFDMPELKIAAIHDNFKSLAVTLQFAGRFPRVGDETVKTPTVIANTGIEEMKTSLQGLYDEDTDWNQLLSDLSFEKISEQERFEEFLHSSQDLSDGEISEDSIAAKLNKNTLVFKFNTIVYRNANSYNQFGIRNGLEKNHRFVRSWENINNNVVFFVTRFVDSPEWTKNKNIEDSILYLFAVYHDPQRNLLYIGSSYKSLTGHRKLAIEVSGKNIIHFQDEEPYRVFEGIDHLVLHQVGLLSGGGARNVRYSMFSGADVHDAIARILSNQSRKSNIYGVGFRHGKPINLGCSRKGKIWCRETGHLNQWTEWCDEIGTFLLNTAYDPSSLIENVLIPKAIENLPDKNPWFLEWPERLNRYNETTVKIIANDINYSFHSWSLVLKNYNKSNNHVEFSIIHNDDDSLQSRYKYILVGGETGFSVDHLNGPKLSIQIGRKSYELTEYLYNYPLILTFTDHCEIEGARIIDPAFEASSFSVELCTAKDWSQTNIRKESWWKDEMTRDDSIQAQAMRWCVEEGFDIVFDDDGANEIADIVAIREETDALVIRLLHCKYSSEDDPGSRVKDLIEVTSQAAKNFHWFWQTEKMVQRMLGRHKERYEKGAGRFFQGSPVFLKKLSRLSREFRKTKNEVFVVQPGMATSNITTQMNSILGSADSYLRVRAGCPLRVWGS